MSSMVNSRLWYGSVLKTMRLSTAGLCCIPQPCATASNHGQLLFCSQRLLHSTHLPQSKLIQTHWTCYKTVSSIFGHYLSLPRGIAFSEADKIYPLLIKGQYSQRWHSTSSVKPNDVDNKTHSSSRDALETTPKEEQSCQEKGFHLVYTAPLKGAVRAIKVFSLATATAAVFGGPVLIWLGNPSVPLSGRVIMSSLVMLVGISTTALLHWLVKGYVIQMYFDEETKTVKLYTLSVFGRKKLHQFNISEAGPPSSATAFSSFQACGKSYFLHAEVFKDRKVLSGLLGAYTELETSDMQGDT